MRSALPIWTSDPGQSSRLRALPSGHRPQVKIGVNDVERHANLCILGTLDKTPTDQGRYIVVNPLHIAPERAGKTANAGRTYLLQMLDQFPAFGRDD